MLYRARLRNKFKLKQLLNYNILIIIITIKKSNII